MWFRELPNYDSVEAKWLYESPPSYTDLAETRRNNFKKAAAVAGGFLAAAALLLVYKRRSN